MPNERIYFADARHSKHNPFAGYGWLKRGTIYWAYRKPGARLGRDGVPVAPITGSSGKRKSVMRFLLSF